MKVILDILFSALLARAEIPLELIAEFELPPGTGAWDVQHWMGDSTYGWAAVIGGWANRQIVYETRLGEGTDTLFIDDTICSTNGEGGHTSVIEKLALAKDEQGDLLFVLVGGVAPWSAGNRTVVVMNSVTGESECIHYNNEAWCNSLESGLAPTELSVWPPLPARSQRILLSTNRQAYCDNTGTNSSYDYARSFMFTVSPFEAVYNQPNVHGIRPFNDEADFKAGVAGHKHIIYDDDDPPYDWNVSAGLALVGSVVEESHSIDTICYQWVDYNPDTGYVYDCTDNRNLAAATTTDGEQRFAVAARVYTDGQIGNGARCYDLNTLDERWESNQFIPHFTLCNNPGIGEIIGYVAYDKLKLYSPDDGSLLDSTISVPRYIVRILDTEDCASKIVTWTSAQNAQTVRIYTMPYPRVELTIALAFGGEVLLRWQSYPTAICYRVCRNLEYSGDLCSDGEVYVTTDTTMVLTPWAGAAQEFYRVEPVFE